MTTRAHAAHQWWAESGTFVPSATVSVYEPGTTDLIAETIYAEDDPDGSVLPNPFTSDASGWASFYLVNAKRVDLHFAKTGYTSATIPSVDVTFPANRFTWEGTYSALTAYQADDVVAYNGETWIALQATTGNAPAAGVNWALVAQKGTSTFDGAKVVNAASGVQTVPTGGADTLLTGFTTEIFDTAAYFDPASPGQFTLPRDGYYRATAIVNVWTRPGYTATLNLFRLRGGSEASFGQTYAVPLDNAAGADVFVQGLYLGQTGDVVRLRGRHTYTAGHEFQYTSPRYFSIEYLGA